MNDQISIYPFSNKDYFINLPKFTLSIGFDNPVHNVCEISAANYLASCADTQCDYESVGGTCYGYGSDIIVPLAEEYDFYSYRNGIVKFDSRDDIGDYYFIHQVLDNT